MRTIIIHIDDDSIDDLEAVTRVRQVMEEGYVSEAAGIPHYCWATVWRNGTTVAATRKRTKDAADSFRVWRGEGR
jgi:hypothetical protein